MGFVWNVMLSHDNEELWEDGEDEPREKCEPLERINAWMPSGRLVSLVGPTCNGDSGNGMDAHLYGGGFKHFDIEGFIEVVKAQDWKARSKVQLWVKGAEEGMGAEPFTLIKLGRRRSGAAAGARSPQTRKRPPVGRKAAVITKETSDPTLQQTGEHDSFLGLPTLPCSLLNLVVR